MNIEERLQELAAKLAERVDTKSCYQCGTCVGACPISRLTGGLVYHPRRFVRATLEGEARKLLEEPVLWLCASCHACVEHCPQGVPVSEIIQELQNLACMLGNAPEDVFNEVENILATGWALAPSESVNKRREELGLAPIPLSERNSKDLETIAKATDLRSRLDLIKAQKKAEAVARAVKEEEAQ